jgi:dynein heavy chain
MNKAEADGDEELPWETLRYLIGEAMYGGRVTNDFDRRVMMCYLEEFCGDFIFDTNQQFYFSRAGFDYQVQAHDTLEQYMDAIEEIPLFTNPGVFGLHANAEIIYFTNFAKDLWRNILEMQTSDGGAEGGMNKEEYISSVASDIQSKLPIVFDTYNIKKKFEVPTPTQVVLMQELDRFNILLDTMSASLSDLQKALSGVIGMGEALEALGNSLFNGFVPDSWKAKAPATLKGLVAWMEHFQGRFKQYKDWDEIEEPKVMWLSGLATPESYLTALIQATCRSKGWALDKSIMYTVVTKEKNPAAIKKKLEFGCYIRGLYLEGARYNSEKDCLDYQRPKELIEEMPLL